MFFSCQISSVASCFWICDAAFHAHTCTEICPHALLHSFISFPIPAGSGSNLELRVGLGIHTSLLFSIQLILAEGKSWRHCNQVVCKQHQSYLPAQPQTFHPLCSRNNRMTLYWCFLVCFFVFLVYLFLLKCEFLLNVALTGICRSSRQPRKDECVPERLDEHVDLHV